MKANLSGKIIVITGGSSGIGEAAARALADMQAKVIITGRSERTKKVAKEIGCDYFIVDYTEFSSVMSFAEKLLEKYSKIDVLVNNVGGVIDDRRETKDGHEMTFQVNHLSGFLLTNLLQERLEVSKAMVINTSSMANRMAKLDFEDLEMKQSYSSMTAYGNAKLMNILHAMELNRRYEGVKAGSFHPGVVATGFAREGGFLAKMFYQTPLKNLFMLTPEQGADTLIWMIVQPHQWRAGEFYTKRKPGRKHSQATPAIAEKLWQVSDKLIQKLMSKAKA